MATKRNQKITVEVVNKRKVKLESTNSDLFAIISDKGEVFLSFDYGDDEEDMVRFTREDFLDAVVAMFPENVAYSFPDDDD